MIKSLWVFIVMFLILIPRTAMGDGISEATRLINHFGEEQEKILLDTLQQLPDEKKAVLEEAIERLKSERKDALQNISNIKWTEESQAKQTSRARRLVDTYTSRHISILNSLLERIPEEGKKGIENALIKSSQDKKRTLKKMERVYEQEKGLERMRKRKLLQKGLERMRKRKLLQPLPVEREPAEGKGLMER